MEGLQGAECDRGEKGVLEPEVPGEERGGTRRGGRGDRGGGNGFDRLACARG